MHVACIAPRRRDCRGARDIDDTGQPRRAGCRLAWGDDELAQHGAGTALSRRRRRRRGPRRARVTVPAKEEGEPMAESVYKVIEIVGSSPKSFDRAARAAIERAAKSLRDLRIAEVVAQDLVIEKGKITAYRVQLKVSYKFEGK
jgi:flavin-binding protein dodecin